MARLNFQPVAVDRIARVEPLVAGQAAHRPQLKQVHQPVEALAVQRIARSASATGAQKRGRDQIRLLRCGGWFAAQQSASIVPTDACSQSDAAGRSSGRQPQRGVPEVHAPRRRKGCNICQARGIRVSYGSNCQNTMRRPAPALPPHNRPSPYCDFVLSLAVCRTPLI